MQSLKTESPFSLVICASKSIVVSVMCIHDNIGIEVNASNLKYSSLWQPLGWWPLFKEHCFLSKNSVSNILWRKLSLLINENVQGFYDVFSYVPFVKNFKNEIKLLILNNPEEEIIAIFALIDCQIVN